MSIHAREESVLHAYLGVMQTVASPCRSHAAVFFSLSVSFFIILSSVHDADIFADVAELPPVDCLPLPGSILPISLTAQFAIDCLLRASAVCPPLVRMKCLQQRHEEPDVVDEVLMLCAVRILASTHKAPHALHVTRLRRFRSSSVFRSFMPS